MVAYTGIGARITPGDVLVIMEDAGYRLARMGFTLRSGKAPGPDQSFQKGAERFEKAKAEIFLPWDAFESECGLSSKWDISLRKIDFQYPQHAAMRWDWVKEVHGGWEKLKPGPRKMHERNMHQLFGVDLGNAYLNQSKFVIYYAPETRNGNPKGGTATAVNMAKKQGIRTLNLLHKENRTILEGFLTEMERKRGIIVENNQ